MNINEAKEEIRNRISIVDYIGQYVELKHTGVNFIGKCPFHDDKNPSFSVSDEKKLFRCFSASCNKTGDIFTFVEEYHHVDFMEALKKLATLANINIDYSNSNFSKEDIEKQKLYEIYQIVANEYYKILFSDKGKAGRDYLNDRHINFDTIKKFGLGYSTDEWTRMYDLLKSKNYTDDILIKSGLFTYKNNKAYDKFFNRVMFPIQNINNKVIAFGGRVLNKEKVDTKYLNSPETSIFKKSNNLFALNKAKYSKYNYFILCEGNVDVIMLHQYGFDNAIASLGTGFNEYQAKMLKRYKNSIILSFDMDTAGINFTLKSIPIFEKENMDIKILDLLPAKDPDEFLNKFGKDELNKRIENAKDPIIFKVYILKRNYDLSKADEYVKYINDICIILSSIKTKIIRDKYIENIALLEKINKFELYDAFDNYIKNNKATIQNEINSKYKNTNSNSVKNNKIPATEKMLINIIIDNKSILEKCLNVLKIEDFVNDYCKKIYNYLLSGLTVTQIFDKVSVEDDALIYNDILTDSNKININDSNRISIVNELIKKVKIDSLNYRINNDKQIKSDFELFNKLFNELKEVKMTKVFINE